MWEFLLLIAVAIAAIVHWWDYSTAVQEYTFAKPANLEKREDIRALLGEKTPIAIEIGALPWRPELAATATWTIGITNQEGDAVLDMPVSSWLELEERPPITNQEALATEMELTTGLADLEGARPWWWLPGLSEPQVNILEPDQVLGLSWVTAERSWIGCSHGAPLTLWLVHSRYRRFLPTSVPDAEGGVQQVDPWSLTVSTAPWIGKVQYIEVTVKPGWCIGLPTHWGFAVRPSQETTGESWIWTAKQQSVWSQAASFLLS
jgi:hypothetical protein